MNATFEKHNTAKLLAVILAMAMVVVGVAVLTSESEVSAANSDLVGDEALSAGVYTVENANENIVLDSTVNNVESIEFRLGGELTSATVTISMTYGTVNGATVDKKIMFDGVDIIVDKGVTLILKLDATTAQPSTFGAHIIQDGDLTINDGATVEFQQTANAPGMTYCSTSTGTPCNLDMVGASQLIFNGANGISEVKVTAQGTAKITFNQTTSTTTGAALNFAEGSQFNMNTEINVDDSNVFIYIGGNTSINGTVNAPSSEIRVPADSTLQIWNNANIVADSIVADGNVIIDKDGFIGTLNTTFATTSLDNAMSLLQTQDEVTIESSTPMYLGDMTSDFIVGEGKILNIVNTTIYDGANPNGTGVSGANFGNNNIDVMVVSGTLNLDNSYIYCGVYVDEEAGGMVNAINVHNLTSNGTMYDSTKVGYGDTLTLSGTVPSGITVDVYGTMVVGDVTINGIVNAYVGSEVSVTGSITVSNTFTLNAGASMELSGTISVRNDTNGGASFVLADTETLTLPALANATSQDQRSIALTAAITVTEQGTFNVNRATSNAATGINSLVVGTGAKFVAEGAVTITGNLSGTIQDKGSITFNGSVASDVTAGIVVYDGVTLTVTSVTGTLTVSDSAEIVYDYLGVNSASDLATGVYISADNSVGLQNVRGVTVAESIVESFNADSTERYYTTNMTVTGTVSKIQNIASGSVTLDNSSVTNANPANTRSPSASMSIVDTLAIGTDVSVIVAAQSEVTIEGTLNVVAQDSTLTNNGTITVEGMITVDGENGTFTQGTVNAVFYRITDSTDASYVDYYTSFAAAIGAIADADDDTVTVYGEVEANENAQVPSGATVVVQGTLTIGIDASITVADGALLNITGTLVDVNGELVVSNNGTGLAGNINNMEYDVKKTSGMTDTYTSLARALANAQPGETVTLSQNVTLGTSITIPVDVTLETGRYRITVEDNVTITVNGTLAIQANGNVIAAETPESTPDSVKRFTWGDDVRIVVTGVVSDASNLVENLQDYMISGAYFTARNVNYATGIAYAAENVHEGIITIVGQVEMGDVQFTAADNRNLAVNVDVFKNSEGVTVSGAPATVVTAGTVTIGQRVTMDIVDGTFTGSIAGTVSGETASVGLTRANGITVSSTTTRTAAGDVENFNLVGTGYTGDVVVSAGTVTAGTIGADGDNTLVIADGATLVIPADVTVTAAAGTTDTDGVAITVDGTMNVTGNLDISGTVDVAGTMNIAKVSNSDATVDLTGTMNVTGTLSVATGEKDAGTLNIGTASPSPSPKAGYLVVGSKPTVLGQTATGAVSGPITMVGNSYVKVYNGGDVTNVTVGANNTQIADLDSTAYYINNELYMEVYVNAGANVVAVGSMDSPLTSDLVGTESILQLQGLNTSGISVVSNWYTDVEMITELANNKVGSVDAIYFDAPASRVIGTISAGIGITIYLDGIAQFNYSEVPVYYGTHVVTIEVKAGYDGTNATITFNGQTIQNGATIETTENGFVLTATGATPADQTIVVEGGSSDNGLGLTDILLIILVILIVVMAIMVALRLMRS